MSGPFSFRLYSDADFRYVGDRGVERHVVHRPGDRTLVEPIEEPCAAVRFVEAAIAAGISVDGDETTRREIARARAECSSPPTRFEPIVAPEMPIEAEPPPALASRRPPGGADTPESLGAHPPTRRSLDASAPPPDPYTDRRPPAEQYHDPRNVMTVTDLDELVRASGGLVRRIDVERNEPPPGAIHPTHSRPQRLDPAAQADPVLLFTGQYELTLTDAQIPSRGPAIAVERIYRSGEPYFGPWGYNWDHSYNVYLRELTDGAIAIWTGRLREDVYRPSARGYEPPAGVFTRLERSTASPSGWELRFASGLRWLLDRPDGWPRSDRVPLVAIEDDAGNRIDLRYDADARLASVADFAGRGLQFGYGRCGLLERLEDHAGRTWRYVHDEDVEHLVEVIGPATEDCPAGYRTRFAYDRDAGHPALVHNIVRVNGPAGEAQVENEYGRDPGSEDFGRVVRQRYGGVESAFAATRLQWLPPQPWATNLPAWRVETLEDGVYQVYTFNYRGDVLDRRFRLARDGTYRLVCYQYRYDVQGNVVEAREPDGSGVSRRYDAGSDDPRRRGDLLETRLVSSRLRPSPSRTIERRRWDPRTGNLKETIDENGAATTVWYDHETGEGSIGRPVRIDFPDVTLPDGETQRASERWTWNAHGQPLTRTDAEGHVTRYDYYESGPAAGYLRSSTVGSVTTEYEYNAWGEVETVRRAGAIVARSQMNAAGQVVRTATRDGESRLAYGPSALLAHVYSPRGEYDDGVVHGEWLRDDFEYDDAGHLRRVTLHANTARPVHTHYRHAPSGRLVEVIDPLGELTRIVWDERGLPIRRISAAGTPEARVETWGYDTCGRVVTHTSPDGLRTDRRYDAWGRPEEIVYPGDEPRTRCVFRYGRGDLSIETRLIGAPAPSAAPVVLKEARRRYDLRGRMVELAAGGIASTRWYDRNSRLVRSVDPAGRSHTFAVNADGQLESAVDPLGHRVEYERDAHGDLIAVREVEREGEARVAYVTELRRDESSRISEVREPGGARTEYRYDARGLATLQVSPSGVASTFQYDAARRHVRTIVRAPGLAAPVEHAWEYDAAGRLVAYTDPDGSRTTWRYGAAGEPTVVVWPDGLPHVRNVEPSGRVSAERTREGTIAAYTFGANGLPSRVTFVPGAGLEPLPDLALAYDGAGRIVGLEQGSLRQELTYDALDRLTADRAGAAVARCAVDDTTGHVEITWPDGRAERRRTDALGRLATVELVRRGSLGLTGSVSEGAVLARFEYVGTTRLARCTLGNGTRVEYAYDAARRPIRVEHRAPDGSVLTSAELLYDAWSRVAAERVAAGAVEARLYEYDALGRLASVRPLADPGSIAVRSAEDAAARLEALRSVAGPSSMEWTWSDAGALLRRRDGAAVATVTSNGLHQPTEIVTSAGGRELFASIGGRRTSDAHYQYARDALGRVVRITDPGGIVVALEYDGLGRVAAATDARGRHTRRWLAGRRLQSEGPEGNRQWSPGLASDEIVESGGVNVWRHYDLRHSLLARTGDDGAVAERYFYAPFGDATRPPSGPSPIAGPPVFAGHEELVPGVYAAGPRTYEARNGVFLEPDAEAYRGAANPYAYAGGDPVNRWDPSGNLLAPLLIGAVIGAATMIYYAVKDAEEHPQHFPTEWLNSPTGFLVSAAYGAGGAVTGMAGAAVEEAFLARFGIGMLAELRAVDVTARTAVPRLLSESLAHGSANMLSGYVMTSTAHSAFPLEARAPSPGSVGEDLLFGAGARFVRGAGVELLDAAAGPLDRHLFGPLRARAQREAEQGVTDLFDPQVIDPWLSMNPSLPSGVMARTARTGQVEVAPSVLSAVRLAAVTAGDQALAERAWLVLRHEVGHRFTSDAHATTGTRRALVSVYHGLLRRSQAVSFFGEFWAESVATGSARAGVAYARRWGTLVIQRQPDGVANSIENVVSYIGRYSARGIRNSK